MWEWMLEVLHLGEGVDGECLAFPSPLQSMFTVNPRLCMSHHAD